MRRRATGLLTVAAFGYAFLYLPIVSVIVYSFNDSRLVTLWGGFSLRWYRSLLQDEEIIDDIQAMLDEFDHRLRLFAQVPDGGGETSGRHRSQHARRSAPDLAGSGRSPLSRPRVVRRACRSPGREARPRLRPR